MPRQKDLKRLVRARMAKTGESYTSARTAVAGPSPRFAPTDAEAAALAYVLQSVGVKNPVTGQPFSVSELFGIGGGIGFAYFVFQYSEFTSVFTGCRINEFVAKGDLITTACDALAIPYEVSTTTSAKVAEKQLRRAWDTAGCAIVTVDRTHLSHYGLSPELAGMMPISVAVTPDDDHVRINDGGHVMALEHAELATARSAVSSQKNRLVTIAAGEIGNVGQGVTAGIALTRQGMLEPPRTNFGVAGLRQWRDLVANESKQRGWPRLFDTGEKRDEALNWAQFWISEDGVGSGYRSLYADFLDFAAAATGRPDLEQVAAGYRAAGKDWAHVASLESADLGTIADRLDRLVEAESELAGRL